MHWKFHLVNKEKRLARRVKEKKNIFYEYGKIESIED